MSAPSTARQSPPCSRRSSPEAEQGGRGRAVGRDRRRAPGAARQAGRADGRLARGRPGHHGLPPRALAPDREHWPQIASTGPRSRAPTRSSAIGREIKRRSDVVGIFPKDAAVVRLVGALMLEASDEWAVTRRTMSLEALARVLRHAQGRMTPSACPPRRPDRPAPLQGPALLHHPQGTTDLRDPRGSVSRPRTASHRGHAETEGGRYRGGGEPGADRHPPVLETRSRRLDPLSICDRFAEAAILAAFLLGA